MKHNLVAHLRKKAIPIKQSCRLLSISCSGYYAAQKQQRASQPVRSVTAHLKALFTASGKAYGSRRLLKALHDKQVIIGRYKVRRLMKSHDLKAVWKPKFIHTTDSQHGLPIADNLLNRQFTQDAPDQAYVTDITYIRTQTGWLYFIFGDGIGFVFS